MAEELDIRSIWNKGKEKEDPSSMHINMMKKKGTKTTLYWIKIILWIEFWSTVVGAPFVTYMIHDLYESYSLTIFQAVLCAVYLFYYQFLIRAINGFSYDGKVVESLKKVYGYLRFYLLHYKAVIWISLVIGFVLGIVQGIKDEGGVPEDAGMKFWLIIIVGSLVATAIMGGIMTFLIHLIYGRKIKRLKRTVKELEKEEE